MNIEAMQTEVYQWAKSKGWEPDPDRTMGDECALIHSEISEVLKAYRLWGFADATDIDTGKPEGVGSELADILIRVIRYSASGRFPLDTANIPLVRTDTLKSFGDWITQMHLQTSAAYLRGYTYSPKRKRKITGRAMAGLLRYVVMMAKLHGIDIEAEYRRKMDYNYTRSYRHGNRAM